MSSRFDSTRTPDVVVIGAGLIGLAIALELNDRGAKVTVVDRRQALEGASTAAAGMLAAEDPFNPAELRELSRLSAQRYPGFLSRLEALSGIAVPFQTRSTVQYREDGSTVRLAEHSLDPRQLAAAVRASVDATSIRLLEHTQISAIDQGAHGATVQLSSGHAIAAQAVVYAAGAWTSEVMAALGGDLLSITPCKGQMLRVRLPFALNEVHRSERVYICPRTHGPQAGTALIGATVENAGFDTAVHADDLDTLRALAAKLVPELGFEAEAPTVEAWGGLRPSTPDGLPMVGAGSRPGEFIATGHYRNGILLAPGTAQVLADVMEGRAPGIDLSALSPLRFACSVTR
jgi:glycine oxidase